MKIDHKLLAEVISDLGLDVPFVKGVDKVIRNCWHFSTDGNAVDAMFCDEPDFVAGMNRIYVTIQDYRVVILAFTLMDTHVHFVLYGEFNECNRFVHEYVRRTSWHIAHRHKESHKLDNVPINHQVVDTDYYLKTVICYTLKNAPVGGINFNALSYPWSSGPLYFQQAGYWNSPAWCSEGFTPYTTGKLQVKDYQKTLRTRKPDEGNARMVGNMVFPGEYVAYDVIDRLYRSCKGFNYFMCRTKEEDVDARGGTISHLSIPMQEMRQHKTEACKELFGVETIKTLSTQQRLRLARTLRSRYNSSLKQIIRLCGLVYEETKDLI